jgi:hypothetical protein
MAACVIAWVLLGCGGGESAAPLSKTAFVKQGNAICVAATKEREAAVSKAAKAGGRELNIEDLINEEALPATKTMVEELDALGVPTGAEKQVEAMVTGFEEGIEEVEGEPKKALGSAAFEKADEAALAYGLSECAI